MKTKFYLIALFIFCITKSEAQNAKLNYQWRFGHNCGVSFSSGSPVSVSGSVGSCNEGDASIADSLGNLLFYTDGIDIYNKNNAKMPSSVSNSYVTNNSAQPCLIVPFPGNSQQYYVFFGNDWNYSIAGLDYIIVDMTLNGGLGDISVPPVLVDLTSHEQMVATWHSNQQDIWIVTHKKNSQDFTAYLLSSSGLNMTPVISTVGMLTDGNNRYGSLRLSHFCNKIVSTLGGNGTNESVQLFDFDNSTGKVSNPLTLGILTTIPGAYSSEFSPDDSKLYVTSYNGNYVYQFDLNNANPLSTITNIASTSAGTKSSVLLGPDGKIYVNISSSNYLDVINSPNSLGAACNYSTNAVTLLGTCGLGLPNFLSTSLPCNPQGPPNCTPSGPNLVANGDFSQGNTGFSSAYSYTNAANGLYPNDYYAVGSDVLYFHSGAIGHVYDHTIGNSTGSYLMCNGATSGKNAWCQTIPVKPNSTYILSAWTTNWSSDTTGGFAILQTSINGVPLPGKDTCSKSNIWRQFIKTWYSGSDTVANICLIDITTIAYGNDFGVDDISLQICSSLPVSSFSPSDTTFCGEGQRCIDFFDRSVNNPTNWHWFFPGAYPDTSTQQNPTHICYNQNGLYDVTLVVSNAFGTDTLTISSMVKFSSGPLPPTISLHGDSVVCTTAYHYQWFINAAPIAGATDSFYVAHLPGTYAVQISDSLGCISVSNGILITSVKELTDGKEIAIYPNPLTSSSTLQLNTQLKDAEVVIYDMLGKEMLRKKLTGDRMEIERGSLESGVYFVRVRSEERQWVEKIIVE